MNDILALDVGTTAFKMGVFSPTLEKRWETSRSYQVDIYDQCKAEIPPEKWWDAFEECCAEGKKFLKSAGVLSLSVTTPGLVPMGRDGEALSPAILFFDGRSNEQAKEIRKLVGEEKFLRETCNLPVSGGSSLCSILWIRENQPDIWNTTAKFGHCNTYFVKRLTGEWAIDPSTTSITGLYNTTRNDLTWNRDVLELSKIPEAKLPTLMPSYQSPGKILPAVADQLGLPRDCQVLCGGNDAVLAALSGGLTNPGDIHNVCGTCEITMVCLDQPIRSSNFNIRAHVIPDRWVTFFVLNTGGIALDWFHAVFCQDMSVDQFYKKFIPSVLTHFFSHHDPDALEDRLPDYIPYLQGSRYSMDPMTASFSKLTLGTTRDQMLLSLIKGNAAYHGWHLKEVGKLIPLGRKVMTTGGVAKIEGMLQAKRRWTGDFEYSYQDQSSLLGAAMLGQLYLTGKYE